MTDRDTPFKDKFDWIRALNDPNSGVTKTQHHVALALSQYLSTAGRGFVSHERLALDTRMSERSVCAALTALADLHWIEKEPGRVGWATTYAIARRFDWQPTPKDDLHTTARKRVPNPRDPEGASKALALVKKIYEATEVDPALADLTDQATKRLRGVLRRQLNSPASDKSGLAKMWEFLTETSLADANNPAAVLLTRYQKFLRHYPHMRPKQPKQPILKTPSHSASRVSGEWLGIGERHREVHESPTCNCPIGSSDHRTGEGVPPCRCHTRRLDQPTCRGTCRVFRDLERRRK
jgi:hypothetical protein